MMGAEATVQVNRSTRKASKLPDEGFWEKSLLMSGKGSQPCRF